MQTMIPKQISAAPATAAPTTRAIEIGDSSLFSVTAIVALIPFLFDVDISFLTLLPRSASLPSTTDDIAVLMLASVTIGPSDVVVV